jgi:protein-L-isoaspartate(D-aspartate) O-methyltransferase
MQTSDSRELMIEQQVRCWDVLDERVLEILREVPRERFVPSAYSDFAFADMDIPLAHGQHMLRPNVVGRLLQALELRDSDHALEVGAGTGFVTACLSKQCASVRSLELIPELASTASRCLAELSIGNAEVVCSDAMSTDTLDSRYDVIALTASLPIYDTRFEQALHVGGRLFVVVGEQPIMDARLVRRISADRWTSDSLFETVLDPMINAARPQLFRF